MKREEVKEVVSELRKNLEETLAKYDLEVLSLNTRFSDTTVDFSIKTIDTEMQLYTPEPYEFDDIKRGIAKRGCVVSIRDDGELFEAVIIKSRRKRYLMAWLNEDDTIGEKFTIPFRGVVLE